MNTGWLHLLLSMSNIPCLACLEQNSFFLLPAIPKRDHVVHPGWLYSPRLVSCLCSVAAPVDCSARDVAKHCKRLGISVGVIPHDYCVASGSAASAEHKESSANKV